MNVDARLYRNVHQVLLAGVVISNALFALGLVLASSRQLTRRRGSSSRRCS